MGIQWREQLKENKKCITSGDTIKQTQVEWPEERIKVSCRGALILPSSDHEYKEIQINRSQILILLGKGKKWKWCWLTFTQGDSIGRSWSKNSVLRRLMTTKPVTDNWTGSTGTTENSTRYKLTNDNWTKDSWTTNKWINDNWTSEKRKSDKWTNEPYLIEKDWHLPVKEF